MHNPRAFWNLRSLDGGLSKLRTSNIHKVAGHGRTKVAVSRTRGTILYVIVLCYVPWRGNIGGDKLGPSYILLRRRRGWGVFNFRRLSGLCRVRALYNSIRPRDLRVKN